MALAIATLQKSRATFSLAAVLLLAGCGEGNKYVAPPPPKVAVAHPIQREITRYLDATGNTAAVNTANLVARVSGFVESVGYADGDFVKKGALLFTIEPQSYELKLAQANAVEAGASATLKKTQADFERQNELVGRGAVSKAQLDAATAARDKAQADLKQFDVEKRLAVLNVSYTRVTAPFDGIVTARKVSVGEYVGGNAAPTVLATIVQLDPIHVNFTVNEQDVLQIRERIRELGLKPEDLKNKVPVEIALQNEAGFPHKGTLDYVSPSIDASTGTVTGRAIFENPAHILVPGLFVRVRVPFPKKLNAMLVPDAALGTDQGGRYLLVVNKDNVVEQRKVEIGPADGDMRAIVNGLKADDRVVVAGILRAIPGQKVDPQLAAGPATKN